MNTPKIKYDENGLIPVIVQHAETKEVLTLAYMNQESLEKSIDTGESWFYSRSRKQLWHKGETSGHTQKIVEMKLDCDQDALVLLVFPAGPACHQGTVSCFAPIEAERSFSDVAASVREEEKKGNTEILSLLEALITEREQERPAGAYTTYLFQEGIDKILKKVGEESAEVMIAAKNSDPEELKWEAADLLYHLLVLLVQQKLPLQEVLQVLEARRQEKP